MKTRQIHGLGLGEFLIFAPAKEMLKSAYFFSALGTQNGFLQTIFSLVWMGFDNEAHYFFSTDLQRLKKKSVFSRLLNLNPQWGKWRCVLI